MDKNITVEICASTDKVSPELYDEFLKIALRCQILGQKLGSAFIGYVSFSDKDLHPLITFECLPSGELIEKLVKLQAAIPDEKNDRELDDDRKKEYDEIRANFPSNGKDIAKLLYEAEPIDAKITAVRAFFLVSLLQVALRHPSLQYERTGYDIGMDIAKRLQAKLSEIHPNIDKIIEMGWLPEYDYKYPPDEPV